MKSQISRKEQLLRVGAIVSVLVMCLLAFQPRSLQGMRVSETLSPDTVITYLVGGSIGAIVAVFHFFMLWECVRKPGVNKRLLWVIFLLLLPAGPAVIYYLHTRSRPIT